MIHVCSSLSFVGGLGLVHAVLQDTTHVGKRLGSGYAFVFSQLSQHQGLLVSWVVLKRLNNILLVSCLRVHLRFEY